ncbi:TonB-dependent receptor [Thiomicrospira microaerophila]|uniref:TonB-dependent receptor n=1 Tax=Thiomicrospira microaerophila TaxID=406020 RepID=UPI0005C97A3A|nr:TonB-dependent receptor [Thiomicrospira microaerophila]
MKASKFALIPSFCITLLSSLPGQALADDDQALQDLLRLLNQQTQLVTKTKLNADYVPGAFSILRAGDLQAYGARTVKDALSMSPSLEVQQNHLGHHTLVTRGFGTPFSGGTVLLMLDHVNKVSAVTGYAETILNMPIEQVERIEIIRGAASVLYGGFAYAGVVNVVTRQSSHASVSAGNFGYRQASIANVFKTESSGQLSLNYSQWQQGKTGRRIQGDPLVYAEPGVIQAVNTLLSAHDLEALHLQQGDIAQYSMAPGIINDRQAYRSFLAQWQQHQTRVYLNLQDVRLGDYYGYAEILPAETQDYNQQFTDWSLGVEQKLDLTDQAQLNFHLGVIQRQFDFNSFYTSKDFDLHPIIMEGLRKDRSYAPFLDKRPITLLATEQVAFLSTDLTYQPSSTHRWLLGAELEQMSIKRADAQGFHSTSATDPQRGNNHARLTNPGDSHQRLGVYLQNEWLPMDALTITLGLRAQIMRVDYDLSSKGVDNTAPFSDLEDWVFMPKFAAVYRLSNQHIFKAQYSRALINLPTHQLNTYRLNDQPSQAQTDHYELGYVFQGDQQIHRFSVFQSQYEQVPEGTVYFNYTRKEGTIGQLAPLNPIKSKGVDWDAEFSVLRNLDGFASASFMRTEDVNNHVPLVGSADFMAKLGFNYRLQSDWRLASWLSHIGPRHRAPYDARESKLPAYTLTNLNLHYTGISKMTLSLAVENVFDKDYAFVSAPNHNLATNQERTQFNAPIAEDYQGMARQFWLKARVDF